MKDIVIFSDLDGTLLDYSDYSFEKALPAIKLLKDKGIPLVICSSKTKKEIEYYRKELNNHHPFISENGGGIFIPENYFGKGIEGLYGGPEDGYIMIRLGASYPKLRKVLEEIRAEGFDITGFGDMDTYELAGIAGITEEEAERAKDRFFDEPFIYKGPPGELSRLFNAINKRGFKYTHGRFFHILGDNNKGSAVSILTDMYTKIRGQVLTVAIGDSQNDISMFERVDFPIMVKRDDGSYDDRIKVTRIVKADGIGADGWNKAISGIIPALENEE